MRIAILAPFAHAAFMPGWKGRTTGGAEFQLRSLGLLLSSLGHEIDYLMEGDQSESLPIDSGKLWRIMPLGGLPVLKLIHPKGSTLLRFLKSRKIDLLIQRGASESTALGMACARIAGLPFLFLLASDSDVQPGHEILPHPQDPVLYRMALKHIRWIVAQTQGQADLLRHFYGKRARIIPSMLPPLPPGGFSSGPHDRILWGGNLRDLKRPEWLIESALRFPDIRFLVFGGRAGGHEIYADRIIVKLRSLPNVEYLGWVAHDEVPELFSRARVFLNTSIVEGFPNTFLEAWRQKIPVISTVDPGGLIREGRLGYFAEDLDNMMVLLRLAWEEKLPELEARLQNGVRYVDDIHGNDRVRAKWLGVLEMLKKEEVH